MEGETASGGVVYSVGCGKKKKEEEEEAAEPPAKSLLAQNSLVCQPLL